METSTTPKRKRLRKLPSSVEDYTLFPNDTIECKDTFSLHSNAILIFICFSSVWCKVLCLSNNKEYIVNSNAQDMVLLKTLMMLQC